ncbi:hypothetical protein E2C01_019879 [Portunus trituberculatus]|uniref:Uncharacterized protein n=1 Tax=Portunus trituberculatus TaxID=210409 RepID=A0A5B7DYF5_PORTR|nr:hypothetical protein [Portunus trituberculatus]
MNVNKQLPAKMSSSSEDAEAVVALFLAYRKSTEKKITVASTTLASTLMAADGQPLPLPSGTSPHVVAAETLTPKFLWLKENVGQEESEEKRYD